MPPRGAVDLELKFFLITPVITVDLVICFFSWLILTLFNNFPFALILYMMHGVVSPSLRWCTQLYNIVYYWRRKRNQHVFEHLLFIDQITFPFITHPTPILTLKLWSRINHWLTTHLQRWILLRLLLLLVWVRALVCRSHISQEKNK